MAQSHRHSSSASGTPLRRSLDLAERRQLAFPAPASIQQPPNAHFRSHSHSYTPSPDPSRIHASRHQSSASSAESGSTTVSYQKPYPISNYYWPSPQPSQVIPHLERSSRTSPQPRWEERSTRKSTQSYRIPEMMERPSPTVTYVHHEENEYAEDEEDHAIWILAWLSFLDPVHSFASCLFTLFTTFGLLLATPIRIFKKQSSLGDQIIRAQAPLYRHHLQMFYAPSLENAFSFEFHPGMLIFLQILSPLVSIGVAVSAWISAAFWVFTFIMGNPDGTERRDDGRDAVLAVRNWWESYFLKALKSRVKPRRSSQQQMSHV